MEIPEKMRPGSYGLTEKAKELLLQETDGVFILANDEPIPQLKTHGQAAGPGIADQSSRVMACTWTCR